MAKIRIVSFSEIAESEGTRLDAEHYVEPCGTGHDPVDINYQSNGPELLVTAHCSRCGYGLAYAIQDNDWEAYGDSVLNG